MRWALALIVATYFPAQGCARGQTGEITELTECERVVGTARIDELAVGERALLNAATGASRSDLVWSVDGSSTMVALEAVLESHLLDRLDAPGCEPTLRVPVTIHASTDDGLLDVEVAGLLDLASGVAVVQGGALLTSLNGRDALAGETEVWLRVEQSSASREGELSFGPDVVATF